MATMYLSIDILLVGKNKLAVYPPVLKQCTLYSFKNSMKPDINLANSMDPDQLAFLVNSVDPDQLASEEVS